MGATPPGTYRQRDTHSLQKLFHSHFAEFAARFEADHACRRGHSRLQRFSRAVDYSKGVAPHPLHQPRLPSRVLPSFSCKVFHPCPSCSQKRTLLFGEYLNERLLLRLPHRQMVFTFPKVLHQYGEIARFHPHLHAIVLEGGFDGKGWFVHIPRLDPAKPSKYIRVCMVSFNRSCCSERIPALAWMRIPARSSRTREALSRYIPRPPVSL